MNETNYYFEIGPYLKKLREKKNLTRAQLADGICSVSYIARIENGNRCPSSVILREITNRLGINVEDLFRVIESPKSLYVKELIIELFLSVERFDFKKMSDLINKEGKNLGTLSIHDKQIIQLAKHCSKAILNKDYASGLKEVQKVLEVTYIIKGTPTDIEFLIMSIYGFLLLLNNQPEDAYEHLINIKKYIDDIKFFHSYETLARYYVHLVLSCLDISKLKEAAVYIDYAIDYCKDHNTHIILRELYFLKAELYYRLGKEKDFKIWYDNSNTLHKLLKSSDDDFFITLVNSRLKKLKISSLA